MERSPASRALSASRQPGPPAVPPPPDRTNRVIASVPESHASELDKSQATAAIRRQSLVPRSHPARGLNPHRTPITERAVSLSHDPQRRTYRRISHTAPRPTVTLRHVVRSPSRTPTFVAPGGISHRSG